MAGLLSSAVAIGSIERIKIFTVNESGVKESPPGGVEIECQFNPTTLKIEKSAEWGSDDAQKSSSGGKSKENPSSGQKNSPKLSFKGGKAARFSLDLLFDTSSEIGERRDVRKVYTNKLLQLTIAKMNGKKMEKPPPLVQVQWGSFTFWKTVVTKVNVTYLLFDSDGTPIRAKANVDFEQQDPGDDIVKGQNPTSRTEARKTRLVQLGDRLDLIAFEEYNHPGYWRYLAEVNNLGNPRDLHPGQILVVPPLE